MSKLSTNERRLLGKILDAAGDAISARREYDDDPSGDYTLTEAASRRFGVALTKWLDAKLEERGLVRGEPVDIVIRNRVPDPYLGKAQCRECGAQRSVFSVIHGICLACERGGGPTVALDGASGKPVSVTAPRRDDDDRG
jgi:hypothetical protein